MCTSIRAAHIFVGGAVLLLDLARSSSTCGPSSHLNDHDIDHHSVPDGTRTPDFTSPDETKTVSAELPVSTSSIELENSARPDTQHEAADCRKEAIHWCHEHHIGKVNSRAPIGLPCIVLSLEEAVYVASKVPLQLSTNSAAHLFSWPTESQKTENGRGGRRRAKDGQPQEPAQRPALETHDVLQRPNKRLRKMTHSKSVSVCGGEFVVSPNRPPLRLESLTAPADTPAFLFNVLVNMANDRPAALLRLAVYGWWKHRGWVVRSGLKFGAEFLLYEKSPDYVHARFAVTFATKDTQWREVCRVARLATATVKEWIFVTVPEGFDFDQVTEENVFAIPLRQCKVTRPSLHSSP